MTNTEDKRNVVDKYKGWATELIREDVQAKTFPFAICMSQLQGDFNIGNVFRSANAFGARSLYYFGKKKFDSRGLVGIGHYSQITYLKSIDELKSLKDQYLFIALEQTDKSLDLKTFNWPKDKPCMILIGEESCGLSQEILDLCDFAVEIKQVGSVRSLNAATAGAIAMNSLVNQLFII